MLSLTTGVVQGSVLVPLLFSFFINNPRPAWKQAFPGYAAQFTSKSAAKLVLKDCGKIEVFAMKLKST
jgi:hypothetical protein